MTTKLSFAESRAEIQAKKNNSDLTNLANALEYIAIGRIELKKAFDKAMEDMAKVEAEIEATATTIENGTVAMFDEVHGLYNKAKKVSNVSL